MADNAVPDQVVKAPTYMADIRFFFSPEDVQHMAAKGIELGTYDGVKKHAQAVFAHTAPPDADMPPDPAPKWSAERSQTFKNWILNKCPLGTATLPGPLSPRATSDRLRRNITSLTAQEIESLRKAFTGLMQRDPSDPDSYYALAGHHGLPETWCLHHENRFNPWHRAYLKVFEDALRSVPGCNAVTLPYWDITTPWPDLLEQPPFASYKLPQDPGATADPSQAGKYFPYTTERFSPEQIAENVKMKGVFDDINTALNQSRWGTFNKGGYQKFSIQAHDSGHNSVGPTMAQQEVSAYDPAFWFFHCNIDRLWLQWQQKATAATLAGFVSTLSGNTDWLLSPPLNALQPFKTTADETISLGISYEFDGPEVPLVNELGSIPAARTFLIKRSAPVSVRVKGIDRLNIPGSFNVTLLADGEPIAQRGFFQPNSPRDCANCREQALVNIDFRLDQEELLDRKLSVQIDVVGQEDIGASFPLSQAGDPTINVRLLLEDE
jgi:tyrosinase